MANCLQKHDNWAMTTMICNEHKLCTTGCEIKRCKFSNHWRAPVLSPVAQRAHYVYIFYANIFSCKFVKNIIITRTSSLFRIMRFVYPTEKNIKVCIWLNNSDAVDTIIALWVIKCSSKNQCSNCYLFLTGCLSDYLVSNLWKYQNLRRTERDYTRIKW